MRLAGLFATAALVAAPVIAAPLAGSAQTVAPVDRFSSVELRGGGSITIHQGPQQRVTLVRGDPDRAQFHVHGGKLVMSPCGHACWGPNRFEVDIETPVLNGAEIMGGGRIVAQGAFPAQDQVSAAIHGGGDIDLRSVPARTASAVIHGGGKIYVAAHDRLDASIFGGGWIRYAGRPAVNRSIFGGGSISPLD